MHLRMFLEAVAAMGTISCLCFYILSACGVASFLNQPQQRPIQSPPPVSILKPLKGTDPEMWESFCTHAEQDYSDFETVFGVSDPTDPAAEVVRKLQRTYSSRKIKLIICDRTLGTNIKVSNLAQMLPHATHDFLLVNDSDLRVESNYLRQVIAPLANLEVGLVTCLYRAEPAATLGSRLEALSIATDFVPGVLSSKFLENGLHFGLGSTLAFRRSDLSAIGGFESILDYLADDYELGRRIAATGKRIELSNAAVTTFLPAYTLGEFWQHQLRWSRTIRDARRWGYAGLIFTFGLPWSLALLIASRGAVWACTLFALTYLTRLGVALVIARRVLHDRNTVRNIFWLPLRDLLAPFIWAAALIGNRIRWRGEDFHLIDGRLKKNKPEVSS